MLLISAAPSAMAEKVIVNPYGQFLEGDGIEVEMATFASKNADGLYDVLLKITGKHAFNAGIDGKTLKYTAVNAGGGVNYKRDGMSVLIMRNPYGSSWQLMEIYLDGKTISVGSNSQKAKEVQPLHLLTASQEK